MDENLTLAHVTYDATFLLLHQNVAYPLSGSRLYFSTKGSADACLSVAIEIATLTAKFLKQVRIAVSAQSSLCVFVAARSILALSIHFGQALDPNFIYL